MKGHSERVPNKNMRLFAGKPLYHRVASVLESSDLIDKIVVNTDSNLIAEDAQRYFAKVIIHERPASIQGDWVSMNTIIAHDIGKLGGDNFLQTHSTNPLLTRDTIEAAIDTYFSLGETFDSVFSVTPWQTRFYWESGLPVNHDPGELIRTQDLQPLFEENSNLYIFSKKSFREAGNRRIGLAPKMFVMNKLEAIDIDEEADFTLAETLYRMQNQMDQL